MTPSLEVIAATSAHDAALRQLLRETPVAGLLRVTLEREPSFFGADLDVTHHDVAMVLQQGMAIACGSRVLRRVFWNGAEQEVAYLSDLRLHPNFQKRGGRALTSGYRLLAQCARRHPAAATWTAVFASNTTAQSVLVGRRAGLPEYVDRGRLVCSLLLIKRRHLWPNRSNCARASQQDLPEITRFLQQELQHRPLAPFLGDSDLANGLRWPDLQAEDFIIARQGQEIIGTVAVRDLRRYKQVRISKTPWLWRFAKLPAQVLAALNFCPTLPNQGEVLAMGFASFLIVRNDDSSTTKNLLNAATALASQKGLSFLSAAFHEGDPKAAGICSLPALKTDGILYQVLIGNRSVIWTTRAPYIDPANL